MSAELKVETEKIKEAAVLKMEGDVTSFAEGDLMGAFDAGLAAGDKKFILDFTKVEYINSSGIAIIIQILSKAKKTEARVLCCGLTPHFQKVFEMVGLKKYTEILGNREEALARLQ
jgi:anti-sigma B factor antagonist